MRIPSHDVAERDRDAIRTKSQDVGGIYARLRAAGTNPGGRAGGASGERVPAREPSREDRPADTVVDTSTVPYGVDQYLGGTVVVMHSALPTGIGSLEDVFSLATGTEVLRGDVDVTITPVPAAVLLGMLGMGVAGVKLRRFA